MSSNQTTKRSAIALISGGLDSMLATKVILDQGIHVEGVNFYTGFCVEGHTHAVRSKNKKKEKRNNSLWVAEQLGIKLHIVDVIEEYKAVVLNPDHGYGKNLNPCLDCKIFMVNKTLAMSGFDTEPFDFVITGEVIGQRPKSQQKELMPVIATESGAHDRLLRPLSAQHLPPTLPEREGWVNRELLHGFSGRNRKPQMELAAKYGFTDYSQPAGGCCFLTDERYANKLKDLWRFQGSKSYELDDILLLKIGRHIRPNSRFKLIVAREEGENRFLRGYRKNFIYIEIDNHEGPLTLIDGNPSAEDLTLAARLAARYSQGKNSPRISATIHHLDGASEQILVPPFAPHEIPDSWHIGL